MSTLIIVIHVIVSVALILIVLLQTGKGADMGAAFGGGSSQTLFGSTGASSFLTKLTTVSAIVFMLTSLTLAYLSSHRTASSVMSDMPSVVSSQDQEAQQGPAQTPTESEGSQASPPGTPPEPVENE